MNRRRSGRAGSIGFGMTLRFHHYGLKGVTDRPRIPPFADTFT